MLKCVEWLVLCCSIYWMCANERMNGWMRACIHVSVCVCKCCACGLTYAALYPSVYKMVCCFGPAKTGVLSYAQIDSVLFLISFSRQHFDFHFDFVRNEKYCGNIQTCSFNKKNMNSNRKTDQNVCVCVCVISILNFPQADCGMWRPQFTRARELNIHALYRPQSEPLTSYLWIFDVNIEYEFNRSRGNWFEFDIDKLLNEFYGQISNAVCFSHRNFNHIRSLFFSFRFPK